MRKQKKKRINEKKNEKARCSVILTEIINVLHINNIFA